MMIRKVKTALFHLGRFKEGVVRRVRAARAVSETSKCRHRLASHCAGSGIDIGFGGDPIVPHAICVDLQQPYARYRKNPQHFSGDARALPWFADQSLDFVYSSHLLEDFEDTTAVLAEWVRVLKPGGRLVLYLPDEQLYRAYCEKKGRQPNEHHIHPDFSLEYLIGVVAALGSLRVVHSASPVEQYSFELVAEKVGQ